MRFTASYLMPQWINMNVILDFINICERHTLEHISSKLGEIARVWNISEKIVACVLDGVSNCKVAGAVNSWTDIHCAAHLINLAVTTATGTNKPSAKPIAKCVGDTSHLIKHFHYSPLATNFLVKKREMNANSVEKKLIQHCVT